MRYYGFGNMYLSSIQQGIQNAHVIHELYNKYTLRDDLTTWSRNHKTMILLNGGYTSNLQQLIQMFSNPTNPFAWAQFNESEEAMGGLLTCVGIILPERIYKTAEYLRHIPQHIKKATISSFLQTGQIEIDGFPDNQLIKLGEWEFSIIQEINKYGLAK